MTQDKQVPDPAQKTAPESMPPEPEGRSDSGSVAQRGGAAAGAVTGDNPDNGLTDDTASDRGSSAPRD